MKIHEYLAEYLAKGWVPIPLAAGKRTPLAKYKGILELDSSAAVSHEEVGRLLQPWADNPEHGCGVLLRPSGLLVVDCDSTEAVKEFIKATGGPCNNIVQTARGAHFYYRRPKGCPPLRTVHRGESQAIDILANGLIVAPPSVHKTGFLYAWVCQGPLQDAPAFAVGFLSAIRERSIAGHTLSPDVVRGAFPNTQAEAMDLLEAIRVRDARVHAMLSTPGLASGVSNDRSHTLWLTINTLIRVLSSDIGPTCQARERLKNTIVQLTDESIAKVIWFGTLGSATVGDKPRERGWQWFCDEISRARLEVVAR